MAEALAMDFALHPQLQADTHLVCSLKLCEARLMDNALFPWVILVPKLAGAREIIDLTEEARALLMEEITLTCEVLKRCFSPDKLNVAALGNQVEQLHVHVIARFQQDSAWPNPVWGNGSRKYDEQACSDCLLRLKGAFAEEDVANEAGE